MESTFELENIERNMKNIYSRVSVNEMTIVIACKNGFWKCSMDPFQI